MPGKNNKSTVRKLRVVADEKIQDSLKLLVEAAVKSFKQEYDIKMENLKSELAEVKNSQDFISRQYDQLKVGYSQLLITNKKQETEIKNLKSTAIELSSQVEKEATKLDDFEQYGRRQNLEIVGIPVQKDENTNAIVQEVAKLLKVTITASDISTSHRLQTKNELKPPPIIVRFVSRDIRNKLFSNRRNARNADFSNFSVNGVESIFINENLIYHKKQLFWKSKQKAKKTGFKFYWTLNGNVFVRKSEDDKPILIKNVHDLALIK